MKKLYIIIDQQYNLSYRAVQAGHAVAEFLLQQSKEDWTNQTLIYVTAKDIEREIFNLERKGLEIVPFREPDVGNKITAIACYADEKLMKKYELN